jgi:hypothetical protein
MILKPKGVALPQDLLEQAKRLNPDGWGVASPNPDNMYVVLIKGKGTTPLCCSKPNSIELWHFRFALSGSKDTHNTQPFLGDPSDCAFAHVGVLKEWPADTTYSDSYRFWNLGETVLRMSMCKDKNGQYGWRRMLGAYCNVTQNRMVLLSYTGEYHIFGEPQGFWQDGYWLSGGLE